MKVLHIDRDGRDRSRFRTDLTQINDPQHGKHMTFNGTTQYFRKAIANWRSSDQQGTILAWINRSEEDVYHCIFSSPDEGATTVYFRSYIWNDNLLQIGTGTTGVWKGSTTISADRWWRVGAISDGTNYSLYVNGVRETLVASVNDGHWFADVNNRDSLMIGAMKISTGDVHHFKGSISDFQVHDVAFNAGQMWDDYVQTEKYY